MSETQTKAPRRYNPAEWTVEVHLKAEGPAAPADVFARGFGTEAEAKQACLRHQGNPGVVLLRIWHNKTLQVTMAPNRAEAALAKPNALPKAVQEALAAPKAPGGITRLPPVGGKIGRSFRSWDSAEALGL